VPGPAPKPPGQRQRRNRTSVAATFEAARAKKPDLPTRYSTWKCLWTSDSPDRSFDEAIKGCPLSGALHTYPSFVKAEVIPHDFEPAEVPWHPLARAWWDVVWASPMAQEEWIDADVPNLMLLVALVDEFWRTGESKLASEVRMASREFGISPMSRRALQWEIKRLEAAAPKPAPPKPRTDHQKRAILSVLK
jgi:hypothetical protein